MTASILLSIVFLILGLAIGYLVMRASSQKALLAGETSAREAERLNQELQQAVSERDNLREQNTKAAAENSALKAQAEGLQQQLSEQRIAAEKAAQETERQKQELRTDYEKQKQELRADFEKQKAEQDEQYRQQLDALRRQQQELMDELHKQQKTQLEQQSTLIREQINTASEQILKKRQDELSATNKEQLSQILNPLHEKLSQMREAVEKSDREQTTSMERLDASIKENLKQAREVGERADRLAQALTGENKTQGNFGELRLRTLLENMGLEEGTQFEEQVTLRDETTGQTLHDEENGQRLQPDVVLHFPDERDIVIDSKMSLKAFLDYYEATTDDERHEALMRHVASVRKHVNELSVKNYSSFIKKGHTKLDFVVMYVYNESALQLALTTDPGLWKEAYDKGVVISGSQNLYMMLRVLELTWRQVRQVENQDKIMDAANEIVNRVQMFYERFLKADDQLDKTRKAFDDLKLTAGPSGKSIAVATRKLLKYGAKENPKRNAKLPADEALEVDESE